MLDLEQVRARHAFGHIAPLAKQEDLRGDLLTLARRLPEMLQTNGLLAAWAYLLAKQDREPAREKLERALREHLSHEAIGLGGLVAKLEGIFSSENGDRRGLAGPELRRLTAEAVVYSGWLKRAAEALCATAEEPIP
jgi:CRISPR type III-B/RAMP module-associated protein Cmr5